MSTRLIPADFDGWWYRRDETHLCFYTGTGACGHRKPVRAVGSIHADARAAPSRFTGIDPFGSILFSWVFSMHFA
ncbi:MAG: hypothetical protein MZW92_02735 [Comamonadaceae bacterium]|nr:hypothetical protein [Comamonadaceae bacterium]